ncbi:MAG: competence/damage-inducible protein A, partial [Gemmatimonadetes bacterium]|nr:competence/damage-inducible protein A [Gemmatimonadota bacterium]
MLEQGGTTAAVISVGNELLFGETVDSNAAWLGRHLSARGIRVVRGYTVGDVAADIEESLDLAMDAADLVIVTGGLGPTPDDLTKAVVARRFGRELVVDGGVQQRLQSHFRSSGYDDVPRRSRGQAEVPRGARALENPSGTAPGILLEVDDVHVVLLPGVPAELKDIVEGALAEHLNALSGPPTHHRVVHTTGLAETSLA